MAQREPAKRSVGASMGASVGASVGATSHRVKARVPVSEEVRRRMVAEAAYYIAQRRGSGPGDPQADWLAAEREIEELLTDTKPG